MRLGTGQRAPAEERMRVGGWAETYPLLSAYIKEQHRGYILRMRVPTLPPLSAGA
jgi:hypothetical protein